MQEIIATERSLPPPFLESRQSTQRVRGRFGVDALKGRGCDQAGFLTFYRFALCKWSAFPEKRALIRQRYVASVRFEAAHCRTATCSRVHPPRRRHFATSSIQFPLLFRPCLGATPELTRETRVLPRFRFTGSTPPGRCWMRLASSRVARELAREPPRRPDAPDVSREGAENCTRAGALPGLIRARIVGIFYGSCTRL